MLLVLDSKELKRFGNFCTNFETFLIFGAELKNGKQEEIQVEK